MTVRDLVQQFERASSISRPPPSSRTMSSTRSSSLASSSRSANLSPPPPSPARFIRQPNAPRNPSHRNSSASRSTLLSSATTLTTSHDIHDDSRFAPEHTADIADTNTESSNTLRDTIPRTTSPPPYWDEKDELLEKSSPNLKDVKSPLSPPSTSRRVTYPHFPPHTPVPSSQLFAEDAAPLHLPRLDQYLSTLQPPTFVNMKGKEDSMFPPMDKLAASERTLEDLETNTTVAPFWRNRTTILGAALNIIVGFTVRGCIMVSLSCR